MRVLDGCRLQASDTCSASPWGPYSLIEVSGMIDRNLQNPAFAGFEDATIFPPKRFLYGERRFCMGKWAQGGANAKLARQIGLKTLEHVALHEQRI